MPCLIKTRHTRKLDCESGSLVEDEKLLTKDYYLLCGWKINMFTCLNGKRSKVKANYILRSVPVLVP